jgi:ubiquinone/menaquinone biosynthesis C-methylase UbiE
MVDMESTIDYIPALGFHWLTPLYDPLVDHLLPEDMLRKRLVLEADILPGMRVLDLGCGTGSLAILIKQSHVLSQVYGLDADPQILDIARSKARKAQTKITLEQGLAYQLPFPDAWFDRVLTSLVFHHLTTQQKKEALDEVYRVLRPGGKFAILDLGVPHDMYSWLVSQVVRRTEQAEANIRGLLPGMIQQTGLINITEIDKFGTIFGSLSLLRAEKQPQAAT